MKKPISRLILGVLLLVSHKVLAQAPNITYTTPLSFYVGTGPGTTSPTNIGGTPGSSLAYGSGTTLSGTSFANPARGAIDASGNLYFADFAGITISKYTSSGTFITSNYTSGGTLANPAGIVFDSSGNMYVLNAAGTVNKYNSSGVYQSAKTINTGYTTYGLTIDASDNIYVCGFNTSTPTTSKIFKIAAGFGTVSTSTTNSSANFTDISIDASGNFFVLDYIAGTILKYTSSFAVSTLISSTATNNFTSSYAMRVDPVNGYIYVVDLGHQNIVVYTTTGTYVTTISAVGDCRGITLDFTGKVYAPNFSTGAVNYYNPTGLYFINKTLPATLTFNSANGNISGTAPTVVDPPLDYTVSAWNSSGGSSFIVNIGVYNALKRWVGGTSSAWATSSNWSPSGAPGSTDQVSIGGPGSAAITNLPSITAADVTVAGITMGTAGGKAPTISFTSSRVLTVTGDITYTNTTTNNYAATISGTGTVNATGIKVIANNNNGAAYTLGLTSSVTNLNLSGDIGLTSQYYTGTNAASAAFNITGGTAVLSGVVTTTNDANALSKSTLSVTNATLKLANGAPLSGLSANGTNVISFDNTGSTIEYSGASPQTLYTNSTTGLTGYKNLVFSGTGSATAASGTLAVSGSFTNTASVVNLSNPTTTVTGTLGNTGTINVDGAVTVGGTLTNSGTITSTTASAYTLAALTNSAGGAFTLGGGTNSISGAVTNANTATFTAAGTTTFGSTVGNTGTFNGGAGNTTFTGAFTNNVTTGVYTASTGTNDFNGTFTNSKTATFPSGSTLTFASTFTNSASSTITANGSSVNFDGAAQTITNSNTTSILTLNDVIFSGSGTKTLGGSTATGFTIASGGSVTMSGTAALTVNASIPFVNNGTFTGGSTALTFGGAFTNGANGTFDAGTGTKTFSAAFVNSGTFNGNSGTTSYASTFTNNATGTYTGGTSANTFTGAFSNAGTYTGSTLSNDFNNSFTNTKTVNFTGGTTTMSSAFTNTSPGTFSATGGSVSFDGATNQTISSTTTTSDVTFNDLIITGGTFTKTLSGAGNFAIGSTGSLTILTTSILNPGTAKLTLKSDINGSANVMALPATTSITSTATVNVERYISGGTANSRGYRLLSSPVSVSSTTLVQPNLTYLKTYAYITGTTGAGGGFDATVSNPTLYFYRENMTPSTNSFTGGNYRGINKINNTTVYSYSFDGGLDANASLPYGNGFLFFFRGNRATNASTSTGVIADPVTLMSTGYLNNGTIIVKDWFNSGSSFLSYTLASPTGIRGYNLVGNPYACTIDWDKYTTSTTTTGAFPNTTVSGTIYVYNPNKKSYAVYIAGNSGAGTNQNDQSSTSSSNLIPSGQGFFVIATAANSKLSFTESAKINSQVPSADLMLSSAPAAGTSTDTRFLRILLSKDTINNEDALIFFKPTAKTTFVLGEDAEYLKGNSIVNLSTMSSDNKALAINTVAFPDNKEIIPLNVNITSNGVYKLKLSEIKNIPAQYSVWLFDAYTKDSLDFKANPTYSFTAQLNDTTTYKSKRFSLVIGQNLALAPRILSFSAIKNTTNVSLTWTTENEANYTKYVIERSIDGGNNFTVVDSLISNGAGTYTTLDTHPEIGTNKYRVKQIDVSGKVTYTDIVAVTYSTPVTPASGAITVYPNPVKYILSVVIKPLVIKQTNYKITISNNTGIVVKTGTTPLPIWIDDMSRLLPGTYFVTVVSDKDGSLVGRTTFIKL